MVWLAPSRDESSAGSVLTPEEVEIWAGNDAGQPDDESPAQTVQGGRERGLILHKLLEEVLTGETADDVDALTARASTLIATLGKTGANNPTTGISAAELAGCVTRTLVLPEILAIRPELVPEFPVYAANDAGDGEQATAGIVDALTIDINGRPAIIVDWKSDVSPNTQTLEHYKAQVLAYLDVTGAKRGLIVLITSGQVLSVTPSPL